MRKLAGLALLGAVITPLGCSTTDSGNTPTGAGAGSVAGNAAGGGGADAGAAPTAGSATAAGANPGGAGSGGAGAGAGGAANGGSAGSVSLPTTLRERLMVSEVELATGVKKGVSNWRIWGRGDLNVAPVFTVPLASCDTLVCYTSGTNDAPVAHVVELTATNELGSELVSQAGVECRGLAAGEGGQFAALLWKEADQTIAVTRYDASGTVVGSTSLTNGDNKPTDFEIGESRLEFGEGRYGAYYHVHSDSGHEGDTLKWVNASSGAETTEWSWGCSHSMSNLLRYNPALGAFMPACVTDCYPGTGSGDFEAVSVGGIYLNHDEKKVMDVDAGCNGSVAGELGSAALAPSGYKLVFNAHQAKVTLGQASYDASRMNQDIGFVAVAEDLTPSSVVWLTTSSGNEADASISRFQPSGGAEQYVVGWSEATKPPQFKLALVDGAGAFLEAPIDVTAAAAWGRRDDPFRTHVDGDVVWTWFDTPGSKTLRIARVDAGPSEACQ
jgi:hypothetical protein